MSKKHFIALADMIRLANSHSGDFDRYTDSQIDQIAHFCQSQNGHFNRARWIAYIKGECGSNGGKR